MLLLLLKIAAGVAVWWLMLRLWLVPVKLMSAWFILVSVLILLPASGMWVFVSPLRYLGVTAYHTERLIMLPMAIAFRLIVFLNPQIRMYIKFDANVDGKPAGWADVPRQRCALVGNHVSFWDICAVLAVYPFWRQFNLRTMLKASLYNLPIFGSAVARQGQFPVYFKSDEEGNFQVDKEKQAPVQEKINAHIDGGGVFAVFPEGALNKNPKVLQPFRFGTFQTIFDHRLPTYYGVIVGNEETWPRGSFLGGRPACLCGRIGAYPIDFDKEDAKAVAIHMRAHMQTVYNEGLRDLESIKAGKVPPGYVKV